MLRKLADLNHKFVFRPIVSILARISDALPITISDAFLWITAYPIVLLILMCSSGASIVNFLLQPRMSELAHDSTRTGIPVMSIVLVYLYFWIIAGVVLLYKRTPYTKHMSLLPIDEIDIKAEIAFVAEKVAGLPKPQLTYQEFLTASHLVVREYTKKYDGYDFYSTKKVKKSFFGRRLKRVVGMRGLYNPMLAEIIMTDTTLWSGVTHEMFHSRGHMNESLVELYTVLSLIESGKPELVYWGYVHWLQVLQRLDKELNEDEGVPDMPELTPEHDPAEEKDSQILDDIQQRIDRTNSKIKQLGYAAWVVILFFPMLIHYGLRTLLMKITRQNDIKEAYGMLPAKYLAAYRTTHQL